MENLCGVGGCERTARAAGWCDTHYRRWRKHGNPGGPIAKRRLCTVRGCAARHESHGYCNAHYRSWRKYGTPHGAQPRSTPPIDRFRAKVDTSGGPDACHPWTAYRDKDGYGMFRAPDRTMKAHRWLVGHLRGAQLAVGETANHHCDNPACVNPRHLYVGTQGDNMRDRDARGRGVAPPRRVRVTLDR